MSIVFPVTFFKNNSVIPSSKFAITECNNPEVILYTESPLGEYAETGAVIKVAEVCWNVEEIEEFPPGAEIIEVEEIEGEFPAEDEPTACECCQNGDTYEITTCGGEVAGVVNLTTLDVSIGDVIKVEESEDCYIVSTKVCTPPDLVFFEKIECLVDPTECCESCGEEPPSENFSYTVCGSEEIAFVSEIQLHSEEALSIWYNCQWYGVGPTTGLLPGPITPLVEQVVSSVLPCDVAQENFAYLRWVKCGTEDEFIYTPCCELPEETSYTPGATTTNNFILPEPSSACYTFEAPSELPEGVEAVGCPEGVVLLNCEESEECNEEPPVEAPKLTIGEEEAQASNDWSCPSGECPFSEPPGTDLPYQVLSTDLDGWYWASIQIAEDAPEGIPINEAFETEGFFEPFDALAGNGLLITDSSVNSYLPAFNFNGIGNLVPGAIYQVNIKQASKINPEAYEGLEGKITIVE